MTNYENSQEWFDSVSACDATGVQSKTFIRLWKKLQENPELAHLAKIETVDGKEKKFIERNYFLSRYPIKIPLEKAKAFFAWQEDQKKLEAYIAQNEFLQNKLEILEKSLEEITKNRDHYKHEYDSLYEYHEEERTDNSTLREEVEELKGKLSELPKPDNDFIPRILLGFVLGGTIISVVQYLWRKYVIS